MHGGTISVASDLNGTVFTVKLKVDFDVNKRKFWYDPVKRDNSCSAKTHISCSDGRKAAENTEQGYPLINDRKNV